MYNYVIVADGWKEVEKMSALVGGLIFRKSDGFECLSSFEDSNETVRSKIVQLKDCIDAEELEENPWGEKDIGGKTCLP